MGEVTEFSDKICRENGLSVIEEPQKNTGISHFEHNMQKEGKSWKEKLRAKIAEISEVKPTEKKEDKWADIRSMQNADMIIAELESADVDSLNVLKSFMWNIHHDDDHTDELTALKKEIKTVDTLIFKMKVLQYIE